MAKKALINKQQRTPKFKVRAYNRCHRCGRPRAYLRRFGVCRICFRDLALAGQIFDLLRLLLQLLQLRRFRSGRSSDR